MERDNKKISIIYILTGIIIILIIYLIFFVYKTYNTDEIKEEPDETLSLPEVASSCTFDMTMDEFNNIDNNKNICSALNKINLTNVNIDGQNLEAVIYYSPSPSVSETGVYVNNALISDNASGVVNHKLTVLDNMLFMTTVDENSANFEAYDKNMAIVYSLADALNSLQITDPAFTTLASTNSNLNTILNTNYIDGSSFIFTSGQITFNSTSKMTCTPGNLSGSTYIITYKGTTFSNPTYTTNVAC